MTVGDVPRIGLRRGEEATDAVAALADLLGGRPGGGRVGIGAALDDLDRQAHPARVPGRAVDHGLGFDAEDTHDPRWWPQGVTSSADASADALVAGRRVAALAWYAKERPEDPASMAGGQGVRVSFVDLDAGRYRHVLLVVPSLGSDGMRLEPLRVHAGGLVWWGPYLHVAATARGFWTCRLDDVLRVPDDLRGPDDRVGVEAGRVATCGYRYVLPVHLGHRGVADGGAEKLRYSFFSLDRAPESPGSPALVVGEYARGDRTRRLVRYALDPTKWLPTTDDTGISRPVDVRHGVAQMQGAVVVRGRWYATTSHGPRTRGSVYVGTPGDLDGGDLDRHRSATPMGVEDLSYWPDEDLLWSATEHPGRRWLFAMRRSWFD